MRLPKWLLCAAGLLYPPLVVAVAGRLADVRLPSRQAFSPGLVSDLAILLALMAAVNLATPWFRRARWQAESARLSPSGDPAERLLLFGLPFAAAPASYGLLLFILGAGVELARWFAAASFLASAAWIWRVLRG